MITLITGGSGCGKSTYAESRMLSYSLPRVYVATMIPCGEDAARRIARHRQLRAGKGFETLEKGVDVGGLPLPEGASVLLECLGNLVANEMFEPDGAGENAEERCLDGIRSLARRAANLAKAPSGICRSWDGSAAASPKWRTRYARSSAASRSG